MADSSLYKTVVDNLHEGVYLVDTERRITYWNNGAERISGFAAERVLGSCCADNILMHVDSEGTLLCRGHCPVADTVRDGQPRQADVYLHHREGHRVPVAVRVWAVRDEEGRITGAVEIFTDQASLVGREAPDAVPRPLHDPVTRVGARPYLEAKLRASLVEWKHHDVPTGVVLFDVDRLDGINARAGRRAGDRVLRMIASTLQHTLRESDLVGRWGDDEFLVILFNVTPSRLRVLAHRLRILVDNSHIVEGAVDLHATVSGGATLVRPGDEADGLVRRLEGLLAESKRAGENTLSDDLQDE